MMFLSGENYGNSPYVIPDIVLRGVCIVASKVSVVSAPVVVKTLTVVVNGAVRTPYGANKSGKESPTSMFKGTIGNSREFRTVLQNTLCDAIGAKMGAKNIRISSITFEECDLGVNAAEDLEFEVL
jgi:hypothetical protein